MKLPKLTVLDTSSGGVVAFAFARPSIENSGCGCWQLVQDIQYELRKKVPE